MYNCLCHGLVWKSNGFWFLIYSSTVRIGLVYVISGFGGSLLSALFIKDGISVGASGALFGLLGSMLSELISNWTMYANKVKKFLYSFRFVCTTVKLNVAALHSICTTLLSYSFRFLCAVSGIAYSHFHHRNKFSSGNPSTCGQLCSYWRICFWISPWVCVSDPPPV